MSTSESTQADPNEALDRYEALIYAQPKTPEERLAALPEAIDAFEAASREHSEYQSKVFAIAGKLTSLREQLHDVLAGQTVLRKGIVYRQDLMSYGHVVRSALINLDDEARS